MSIQYEMSKLIKVVDTYSGKAVNGAKILLFDKNRFMDKSDGFYVATNLESGLYSALVTAEGYDEKNVDIDVSGNCDCQLVLLNRCGKFDVIRVPFLLTNKFGTMHKYKILYSFDVADLKRVVAAKCEASDGEIKLQNNVFLSLEGRKIGFDNGAVYNLGYYSFVSDRYSIKSKIKENIPIGCICNLLIEAQSDENGLVILEIPLYMADKTLVNLKIYDNGSVYKYTITKNEYLNVCKEDIEEKALKLMLGSD